MGRKRTGFMRMVLAAGLAGFAAHASTVSGNDKTVAGPDQIVLSTGKILAVKTVMVDPTDPMLRIEPVTAAGGIGYDEPFDSLIERSGAVAAVNGTFFNAYEKEPDVRFPNGLMMAAGRVLHSGENQALFMSANKTMNIRQISLGVRVTFIRGKTTSSYFPWGINKYYGDQETDQVVWYTPDMGREIDWPGGTRIVIRENQVTDITRNPVLVPEDGYVCFVGDSDNNKQNLLPGIAIGDTVEAMTVIGDEATGEELDSSEWISAIGGGPKLVTGGNVDVDFKRDGFDDPKITTQSNRRSFIGVDGNGRLVMGTVDNATVREEAEAAVSLGLSEAINLDGGSSSGLYGDGRVLTRPGRRLSNALVVRRMPEAQVQIRINGLFIPDLQGFIRNDTAMVPIRPLLTAMGAEFIWDETASTLTVRKDGRTMIVKPGERQVSLNGELRLLPEAPVLADGHLVLPLRFMIETWGGKVAWDPRLFRASIELDAGRGAAGEEGSHDGNG